MCINISLTLFFKTTKTKHFHCVRDTVGAERGSVHEAEGWVLAGHPFACSGRGNPGLRARVVELEGHASTHTQGYALGSGRKSKAGVARTLVQPNSSRLHSTPHFRLWPAQQNFILVGARVPWNGSPCPKPELQFDFSGCK